MMTFANLKINVWNKFTLCEDFSFSLELIKGGLNFTDTGFNFKMQNCVSLLLKVIFVYP